MDGDRRLHIHTDPAALARAVAARCAELARAAQASHGGFHVALAGGSTPRLLYRLPAAEYRERIDGAPTHGYCGGERCVAPEHPDSNYGMAREALLQHVAIPPAQIHRIEGEDPDPGAAARRYADLLHRQLPRARGGLESTPGAFEQHYGPLRFQLGNVPAEGWLAGAGGPCGREQAAMLQHRQERPDQRPVEIHFVHL